MTDNAPWKAFHGRLSAQKPEGRTVAAQPPARVSQAAVAGGTPYGLAALRRECDELAATPEGGRNDQLNRAAFNLAQLAAGGALDEHAARQALTDATRRLDARKAGRSMSAQPFPLLSWLASLEGQQVPGGCDSCDAYQVVREEKTNWLRITVYHDDNCPALQPLARLRLRHLRTENDG